VNINVERLQTLVNEMHESLPGLQATDIWIADAGESLAAYNGQPAALEVTNNLTNLLIESLTASGFPPINRYYLLDLSGDLASMVILHGDGLRQGVLLDTRFTNIGTMLALGLPMALRGVEEARAAA
jgi:hypothetical protein